ncbi:MAG: iron-containing alcohol dehydrogenase [Collinsella sp.]
MFSIINPELFFTLPHRQMANGVSDMMSHIFERYFTRTLHTDLSDGLCEATLRTIMRNARILNGNLHDYDAWAEIAFSGNIAHNNLLGVGREQDSACHAMEHELSALYHVDHGAGLAVVTPAWMKYVSPAPGHVPSQFSLNVMRVEGSCRETETIIREGIARLEGFYRELGLPTSMEELGIRPEDFPLMAEQAISVRARRRTGKAGCGRRPKHLPAGLPQWRELIAGRPKRTVQGSGSGPAPPESLRPHPPQRTSRRQCGNRSMTGKRKDREDTVRSMQSPINHLE